MVKRKVLMEAMPHVELGISLIEYMQTLFGAAISHQATQFGIAFSLAAFIHARQVRSEIATQMTSVVSSIDSVAKAIREDLAEQSARIELVESGVQKLNNRVEKLETKGSI